MRKCSQDDNLKLYSIMCTFGNLAFRLAASQSHVLKSTSANLANLTDVLNNRTWWWFSGESKAMTTDLVSGLSLMRSQRLLIVLGFRRREHMGHWFSRTPVCLIVKLKRANEEQAVSHPSTADKEISEWIIGSEKTQVYKHSKTTLQLSLLLSCGHPPIHRGSRRDGSHCGSNQALIHNWIVRRLDLPLRVPWVT